MADVLTVLAGLTLWPVQVGGCEGWPPLATLGEPAVFRGLVERAATRLPQAEPRVVASTVQLGLCARITYVALGCAAAGVEPPMAALRWSDDRGSVALGLAAARDGQRGVGAVGRDGQRGVGSGGGAQGSAGGEGGGAAGGGATGGGTGGGASAAAAGDVLALIAGAAREAYGLPAGLLEGNEASAYAGAARLLGVAVELPPRLREHMLGGRRAKTCCLFYRVPGGGVCGDCVFDEPPARPA